MSDTPKTDAAVFTVDVAFVSHNGLASEPKEVVEPDFARELERENAVLRKTLAEADVLYEYARDDGRREWAVVETWIRRGDIIVQMDRAAFDAVRAKEDKP